MSASELNKATRSWGLSVAVTCFASALLVLLKETNSGVLNLMKGLTVHHWVTHGLFNILVFLLLGVAFSQMGGGDGPKLSDDLLIKLVAGSFILSGLIIAVFYVIEG
jgi:hypothetical protein